MAKYTMATGFASVAVSKTAKAFHGCLSALLTCMSSSASLSELRKEAIALSTMNNPIPINTVKLTQRNTGEASTIIGEIIFPRNTARKANTPSMTPVPAPAANPDFQPYRAPMVIVSAELDPTGIAMASPATTP